MWSEGVAYTVWAWLGVWLPVPDLGSEKLATMEKARSKANYARNPTPKQQASIKSYASDPSKRRAASKKSYASDPSKQRAASKKSYASDPSKQIAASKKSYTSDPTKAKLASKQRSIKLTSSAYKLLSCSTMALIEVRR